MTLLKASLLQDTLGLRFDMHDGFHLQTFHADRQIQALSRTSECPENVQEQKNTTPDAAAKNITDMTADKQIFLAKAGSPNFCPHCKGVTLAITRTIWPIQRLHLLK